MKKKTKPDTVANESTITVNPIPQSQVYGLIEHITDTKTNFHNMWEYVQNKSDKIDRLEKHDDEVTKLQIEKDREIENIFEKMIYLFDCDNKYIKDLYEKHFKTIFFLMYSTTINICLLLGIIIYLIIKH